MAEDYAVFDADGTLWREDLGEAFLLYLQKNKWIPPHCFSEVKRIEQTDPLTAYVLTVQCMAGLPAKRVAELAHRFANPWVKERVREDVWDLVENCKANGHKLVLVSATSELVLQQLDILDDFEIHGIRTAIVEGKLTDRVLYPVTYGEGKFEFLKKHFSRPPRMAAGDSPGDLPMLEYAEIGVWVGEEDIELPPGIVRLSGL